MEMALRSVKMGAESNRHPFGMYLLLLLVPLFWGGAFGAAEHVVTEVPPITAAALRFAAAGFGLWAIATLSGEWNKEVMIKNWQGLLFMALTGIFGYNVFFFMGLEYTSSVNGSLIIATTPVFVTLGAVLIFHEPWNGKIGAGMLLSFAGVSLVILKGSLHTIVTLTFNRGDLLFVAALVCWVAHGLIGKAVLKEASPLLTTAVTTMAGAFALFIVSLFEGGWGQVPGMSVQSWLEMLFMIVCSSIIAFLLWNKGIKEIGASKSSLYMNLVPINAALIAFFLYGSDISRQQIFGMLMVITGVFVAASSRGKDNAETKMTTGAI
jgi:drug/metabolite transporter (DMT)-like permease